VAGLQLVVRVDVLIVKMMAQLATRNVVAARPAPRPAAIVVGLTRVVLVDVLIVKMMDQLATVNAAGAGPLLQHRLNRHLHHHHHPHHAGRHPLNAMGH